MPSKVISSQLQNRLRYPTINALASREARMKGRPNLEFTSLIYSSLSGFLSP